MSNKQENKTYVEFFRLTEDSAHKVEEMFRETMRKNQFNVQESLEYCYKNCSSENERNFVTFFAGYITGTEEYRLKVGSMLGFIQLNDDKNEQK